MHVVEITLLGKKLPVESDGDILNIYAIKSYLDFGVMGGIKKEKRVTAL